MIARNELINTLRDVLRIDGSLNAADRLICMSEILKETCAAEGVDAEKISVLGNRVDTARFRPADGRPNSPGLIRALFIGRLEEQKNLHGVTAALAGLRRRGWAVHIDICGGYGMNEYLRNAVRCLKRCEYTYHAAVVNRRLPALYQRADMYVGPSFFEGFQIPLIEALACGTPCVASDQPPANEILTHEVAELVDPEDHDSIREGIERMKRRLNAPAHGRAIRQACRAHAMERWDTSLVSRIEAAIYLRAIEEHAKCRSRAA
ncbi:MAG TPA: glycosyltransferase family 4 protein [Phycisphaerae bacterium]|nr:glycosyltransferase family 4 protein [Phycisphaerae bacterium]